MKNILMRIATVNAVTDAVPRALLALWSMMLPIAVMENCRPMGRPMESRRFCLSQSLAFSSAER